MRINIEKLRSDLMDHYGTATGFFPMAIMDVVDVERATPDELVEMAEDAGFDLNKYAE